MERAQESTSIDVFDSVFTTYHTPPSELLAHIRLSAPFDQPRYEGGIRTHTPPLDHREHECPIPQEQIHS
ncbi:hypothetical protein FIBSPDRAFT_861951 [Athelia psychrophila]|uniref:Uncharacterized protein n=1 Tax=Athelia psychrophila TaxID=1759441 RepID=A0A166ITP0_9AGAM|nr:hypothetical protein FIBSPDRAFT_879526 [Fibularhizoctonia sp. CBS 109695]KZP20158.1 hypothetical protein FIBSPDRAFT_861951 [Fibularhizoctonia sp. CBS 109695]